MDTTTQHIEKQAQLFKALGHPSRLRMVHFLKGGARCVCELQELIGSDMSTVSRHLSVLKNAKIVKDEKKGTNVYYSLALPCLSAFLECTYDTPFRRKCCVESMGITNGNHEVEG